MKTSAASSGESPESSESLAARAAAAFEARFGRAANVLVQAPGRVNLIGEHIDYNDGFVLPMAIERRVVIAAGPSAAESQVVEVLTANGEARGGRGDARVGADGAGRQATLYSALKNEEAVVPLNAPVPRGQHLHWSNYCRGVLQGFLDRGINVPAFDAVIDADLPLGGGLSSSAALEVAAATAIEALTARPLPPVEKALLCQKAEHDYAGVPCGIMDQFASVLSRRDHLLLLDCRSKQVQHVPLIGAKVAVLIINTNVHHELAGGEYAKRRKQCEAAAAALGVASLRDATMGQLDAVRRRMDDVTYRRGRHVIGEIARTVAAAEALRAGQWSTVGRLMYASHESLRSDYEVSCPELDAVVEIARELGEAAGVIGCRMTGGGFGGCCVCLVREDAANRVAKAIEQRYGTRGGKSLTHFVTHPAQGASVLRG